jgi:hypothetical protein
VLDSSHLGRNLNMPAEQSLLPAWRFPGVKIFDRQKGGGMRGDQGQESAADPARSEAIIADRNSAQKEVQRERCCWV